MTLTVRREDETMDIAVIPEKIRRVNIKSVSGSGTMPRVSAP